MPGLVGPPSCGTARGDGHGVQVTSLLSAEGNPGLSKQPHRAAQPNATGFRVLRQRSFGDPLAFYLK